MAKNLKMKAARAAMDMSQQELADRIEVSRQTINEIEKGNYNPTIKLCIAICKTLGFANRNSESFVIFHVICIFDWNLKDWTIADIPVFICIAYS